MALVVFLRGINVGGHRRFRPSLLAKQLRVYDVVNIGAAGTLVVRNPGPRAKFLAELRRELPSDAIFATCNGHELLRFGADNPFGPAPLAPDITPFVSVLSKSTRRKICFPVFLPNDRDWLVRILGRNGRFVYGSYRRHMKTIGYLGQIDTLFGAPATTRSWSTILSVLQILKCHHPPPPAKHALQ